MIDFFAGAVFTDWYWGPLLYFMFTWPAAIALAVVLLIIVGKYISKHSKSKKDKDMLSNKTVAKTVLVILGLWILSYIVFTTIGIQINF